MISEAASQGATRLDLHDLPLSRIPPEIGSLVHLEVLLLGNRVLTGESWDDWGWASSPVPKTFSDLSPLAGLTALRDLDLTECKRLVTVELPSTLVALKRVDMSECGRLIALKIPNTLVCLEHLDLSGCLHLASFS